MKNFLKLSAFLLISILSQSSHAQGKLYVTLPGDVSTWGVILKMNGDGSNPVIETLNTPPNGSALYGRSFGRMVSYNNKLYGTTQEMLFEYDQANHFFINKGSSYVTVGSPLVYNGKLYFPRLWDYPGTPACDGNAFGTIVEANANGDSYTQTKVTFTNSNGIHPIGQLVLYNGKFYGFARGGCAGNWPTIFSIAPDFSTGINVEYIFDQTNSIGGPIGSLVVGANGKLYALATGGANSSGVIVEFSNNTLTKKYDFSWSTGSVGSLGGSLMQHSNGKLYGVVSSGEHMETEQYSSLILSRMFLRRNLIFQVQTENIQ